MFSEYDQRTKNYAYKSREVLAKGILLPPQAPKEYAERQTLWNAVEKSEKQWNAQLARGFIIALPRELPKEQFEPLIREYCQQQFVSNGMIADYAIHDKGDGNPHAHIMLTMRAMDEQGQWLPKARKIYDLDEHGNKIKLPSGNYKSHKENTVDWNDPGKAEIWRTAWAGLVNLYLERAERPERIDLRSYARQGKEEAPTIHLGPAVSHLEQKGIQTEIGNYNRAIKGNNRLLKRLKELLFSVSKWLKEKKAALQKLTEPEKPQPTIYDFVIRFVELRKQGRADWSRKSKEKAGVNDLKFMSSVFCWMTEHDVRTLDDFQRFIEEKKAIFSELNETNREIRRIQTALKHIAVFEKNQPVYLQSKRGFDFVKKKYAEAHKDEIAAYVKAVKYLKANGVQAADKDNLIRGLKSLEAQRTKMSDVLENQDIDPSLIGRIQYCIKTVMEAGEVPDHQVSIEEQLNRPLLHNLKITKESGSEKRNPQISKKSITNNRKMESL